MLMHMYLGYISALLLTVSPLVWGLRNTQELCDRDPPDTAASRTPGDNGFQIKIVGRPQPERYTPDQVYTIVINGTYPKQTLLGFMLVAVPLNAQDESTSLGNFQHMSNGVTQFAPDCPYVVTHSYTNPKAGVEVLWTAPPVGTGCIEFRATVMEFTDIWYKNDGALTRVFCEETGTTENNQSPEMMPECCACGTAKYQMTFEGLWSRRTHPKDFPERKRLLHWSNIVGASHSKHYTLWQYGGYSSPGVKQVCEFGYARILEQEMRDHSRDVRTVVKTPGIWWKESHGLEQTRWARFSVDSKNHLISMLTMLGPSPDWCVGISAINLCLSNCSWTGDIEMNLYPWDAGTDDGITYMAPNKVSNPPQKIHRITNTFPNSPDAPFYGSVPMEPLAKLKIRRIHPKAGDPLVCTGNEDFEDFEEDIEDSEDVALDDMEKKKLMMMKKGKCGLTDWAEWSECSVTCGVGQRFRKRMYLNSDMDETMCNQPTMESENCIGVENECETLKDECAVSRWSDWSPCSATCGKGTRMRQRFFYRAEDMKICERKLEEREICMAKVLDCSKALAMLNFTAICSEAMNSGPCRGYFPRFYFDMDMNKCLPFTYTGCRGNKNNFMTEEDCREMCFPVMMKKMQEEDKVVTGKGQIDPNQEQEDDPSALCALDHDTGPCRSSLTRYYFDTKMLKCLPFTYGGCQGNDNNFESEDACNDVCFMVMNKQMMERKTKGEKATKNRKDTNNKGRKTGPKVDCMVTPWSDWTPCSASCGRGHKNRSRMVKREPENGGKKCPKKLEKRKRCKLPRCKGDRHQQGVTEIHGKIKTNKETERTRQQSKRGGQGHAGSSHTRKSSDKTTRGRMEGQSHKKSPDTKKSPDKTRGRTKGQGHKASLDTKKSPDKARGRTKGQGHDESPVTNKSPDKTRGMTRGHEGSKDTNQQSHSKFTEGQDRRRKNKGQGDPKNNITEGQRHEKQKKTRSRGKDYKESNVENTQGQQNNTKVQGQYRKEKGQGHHTKHKSQRKSDKETDQHTGKQNKGRDSKGKEKGQEELDRGQGHSSKQSHTDDHKNTKRTNHNKDMKGAKMGKSESMQFRQMSSEGPTLRIRDCVVTDWSDWSHCSVTCGRGYQYKRRSIEAVDKNGGNPCPTKLEQKRRCTMSECRDERCKMSNWGPWTPCPQTCGTDSIQERTRHVQSAPNNDASVCGPRIERRYCTLPPCPSQKGRFTAGGRRP